LNSSALWKEKYEGKHRFFGWLFVQEKIQTADNLLLKGIECDPSVLSLSSGASKRLLTYACSVVLLRRYGFWSELGRKGSSMCHYQEFKLRNGGTPRCKPQAQRTGARSPQFCFTRFGMCGTNGTGEFSKGSHSHLSEF